MKTALYLRVSTGLQAIDGYSLDSQEQFCLQKAKELNVNDINIEIYREEGVSGEDLDRPELNRLRNDVAQGLMERVICVHPDRLSRDLTDKLLICRELQKFNVELVFVDTEYKNTPEGQLFFNMQSVIAQYELSLIRKRTTRGRLEAVRKEKKVMPMRTAPFGYDLINSQLVINEAEAFFVNKIYEWYIYEKLTLREIGEKLYTFGAVPKRGESKNWSASSIRRILTSPIYSGKYTYNKRKTKKIKGERTPSGKPKKKINIRDESEWITIDVPSIVTNELFDLAQKQRVINTIKSGNQKFDYLLKSLLRCGHCGRIYEATTYSGRENKTTGERIKYPVYRCPNLYPKRYGPEIEKCNSRSIRADLLEDYIWDLILHLVSNPDELINEYKENFIGSISDIENTLNVVYQSQKSKVKERERVKQLFVKGFIDEEEMTLEFGKINNEIKKLEEEIEKYENVVEEYNTHKNDKEKLNSILKFINEIIDKSHSVLSFGEKRFIIENLIDEIILTFEEDKETVNVNLLGAAKELLLTPFDNDDLSSSTHHQKV